MAKYTNLPELRGQLTAEEPDTRAQAYQAVLEADVQPSAVLSSEPPEETLINQGVIPEKENTNTTPASEYREQQVELLEQILEQLKNGGNETKNSGGSK